MLVISIDAVSSRIWLNVWYGFWVYVLVMQAVVVLYCCVRNASYCVGGLILFVSFRGCVSFELVWVWCVWLVIETYIAYWNTVCGVG